MALEYELRPSQQHKKIIEENQSATEKIFSEKPVFRVKPEKMEELYQIAQQIDYNELGITGEIIHRIYGGELETPYGTKKWIGSAPEDVQKFINEIENAL